MCMCGNNRSPASSQCDPKRLIFYSPSYYVHFAAHKKPPEAESELVEVTFLYKLCFTDTSYMQCGDKHIR